MASKNRPRDLVKAIIEDAKWEANARYPEDEGYSVTCHGNEIWIDKGDKEVLTIFITRESH